MEKLTKARIEEMANEVAAYCYKHGYGDVILYYNGKRRFVDYYGHERDEIQENIDPHDYMQYVAYDHILSISSEGGLDLEYEAFDMESGGIEEIFDKYGCYSELGTSWYTSLYPNNSDMEVEYDNYECPKEREYIYKNRDYPANINGLINVYNNSVNKHKSECYGSCIIGDGIEFELDEQPYFFSTNYNQSEAPTEVIEECKKYLNSIGAINIHYNCGRLD